MCAAHAAPQLHMQHRTIILPHSTNQIIVFLLLSMLLLSFLFKLSIDSWQDCTLWISGTGQLPIHFMYFPRHNHSILRLTLLNSSKALLIPCFHMATSPSLMRCNLPLTYWKSLKYTTETSKELQTSRTGKRQINLILKAKHLSGLNWEGLITTSLLKRTPDSTTIDTTL